MSVSAALLAAGGGSRFGAPKLLLPAGPGEVLLSRAARLALAVAEQVLCILPEDAALHRAALAGLAGDRLTLVENPDAARGMGTSLALAAKTCLQRGLGGGGLLVLPADLPTVDGPFLHRLIAAFGDVDRCDAAAVQDRDGRLQAPAVLGPDLMTELVSLQADEGARAFLRRPGAKVVAVAFEGELEDIDDIDAYRRLARRLGWDREEAPVVSWLDAWPPRADPSAGGWRIGATLAMPVPGHGAGISGYAGQRLPDGVVRVLCSGEKAEDRLQLLRTAALLSLRDESR